jgi:hypothetical protein
MANTTFTDFRAVLVEEEPDTTLVGFEWTARSFDTASLKTAPPQEYIRADQIVSHIGSSFRVGAAAVTLRAIDRMPPLKMEGRPTKPTLAIYSAQTADKSQRTH